MVEKAIDGERSGSMGLEKDPRGWIGKRVMELGSWIGRCRVDLLVKKSGLRGSWIGRLGW